MSNKTEKEIKKAVSSLALDLNLACNDVVKLIELCGDDRHNLRILAPILKGITDSLISLDINALSFGVDEDLL